MLSMTMHRVDHLPSLLSIQPSLGAKGVPVPFFATMTNISPPAGSASSPIPFHWTSQALIFEGQPHSLTSAFTIGMKACVVYGCLSMSRTLNASPLTNPTFGVALKTLIPVTAPLPSG